LRPSPPTRLTLLAPLLACAFVKAPTARGVDFYAAQAARGDAKQSAPKKADGKAAAQAARARRETRAAVAALKEAAELARSFEDVYESVRAQAEAADALWPFDEQWSRSVLRRGWDATNAPGAEEHVQRFGTSDDPREDARESLMDARRLVIKVALKHDARLGEALMGELVRSSADAQGGTPDADDFASLPRPHRTLSAAGRQRLAIARQFISDGDFRAAASAAASVAAEGATPELLIFILLLRSQEPAAADALYLRLLASARSDPLADANDVLLLSTPVVSPELIVYLNTDGSAGFMPLRVLRDDGSVAVVSLPAAARLAFFETAGAVLLRQRSARAGAAAGADAAAVYFAVGRLLPFFEREAPQLAPALNARLVALAAELEASRREALKSKMEVSSLTRKNPADPLAFLMEEVRRATNAAERDFARLVLVSQAARLALWERARTASEEIEGGEARQAARLAIAIQQVSAVGQAYEDEGADGVERAVASVKAANVPPEARALGLAQAAELTAREGAAARADALLAEAAELAAGADRGAQRTSALAHVTLSAARAGSARVWELLPAFVRAADATDELRYGAMLLDFNVGTSERKLWVTAPGRAVGLDQLFAEAARLDAVKTLTEARGFADEEMRAASLLAAGRAALEKSGRAELLRRGAK
jgi:hypothetical protein